MSIIMQLQNRQYETDNYLCNYGIADTCRLDDDRDAWVSTVKEKGMQWVNVLREGREATEKYGVRGVPSNYLIDCSTGKIIAVKLRGNELAEKLAEVM
jgi:hypothetical protein